MAQGYKLGAYDVLFATNVLHATRDMGNTLQHCKALLRKGGLLIANELSTKTEFLTLTFGITDGWWLYDDVERRIPGSPILSRCMHAAASPATVGACPVWAALLPVFAILLACMPIESSVLGDLKIEGCSGVNMHADVRVHSWQGVVEGADGGAGLWERGDCRRGVE